ncbi:hypothetical protein HUJ04_005481 [Dendroctonus ponderosae]|nr:hypothetical protein HUJ04_005481 [Dendroctonus ponderosae]
MDGSGSIISVQIGLLVTLVAAPSARGGFACLSNPCLHGVCMDDLNSTYFCYCIDGYTGLQCQTNWNDCWSAPCQNGGMCVDGIAGFNCTCPTGYVGDLCEEDFNECESNPCWNNGTCVDGPNGYFCQCLPGYLGVHCEVDEAVCNITGESRCHNGGACVEGPGDRFSCRCQQGWEGFLCDVETNECMSSPCQNGAVCIDMHATHECACPFGFAGQNCEEIVRMCSKNPCKNGALCLLEDNLPVCYCVPDFHGDLCQLQYDECLLGPKCSNGGTCIDGVDQFTCSCPPNLTGTFCECLMLPNNQLDCTYVLPMTTTTYYFVNETTFTSTEFFPTTSAETTTMELEASSTTTEQFTDSTLISSETTEEATTLETTTFEAETSSIPSTVTAQYSSSPASTGDETSPYSTQLTTIDYSRGPTSSSVETTTDEVLNLGSTETTIAETGEASRAFPEEIITSTTLFFTEQPSTEHQGSTETTPSDYSESTQATTLIDGATTMGFTESATTSSSIDCSLADESCENGGTCIFASGKHQCVCPFDAEGPLCATKLGIKNAAFNGNSFLTHRLSDGQNISVELEAKTLFSTGLIFDVHMDQAFMALYVENGFLMFKFSCGYQTMLLSELKVPINNGFWINHCYAQIKLNGTLTMTGNQMAHLNKYSKTVVRMHLGGIPNEILHNGLPMQGFVGCMSHLMENRFTFKKTQRMVSGSRNVPLWDVWRIHVKTELLALRTKKTGNAIAEMGQTCDISICNNNPCLFGGTCVPFSNSGYICLCPYGKHGHFCENDLQISEPYFSSTVKGLSSYVAYQLPEGVSQRMEIKFRFTPTTADQISLLLFIGQDGQHDAYSDHLAVSFVQGYILLTWNMGSGPRRIFTTKPVETGSRDYLVQVGYNERQAWLFVENMGNVSGRSPGPSTQLNTTPLLYFGGHDALNFSTLPHDLPLHSGFSGCIFDVEVKIGSIVLPLQGGALGRAVGQCGTTECYERSCQNNGACLHHGSTFMCLCQDKWHGPLCSSRANSCDSNVTKCSHPSQCVPLLIGYECDCPLGLVGRYCEKAENISDVSFTGTRSFLATHPLDLDSTKFNIEMEIRALHDNGLVLFMGRKEASFICLSMQNGLLELKLRSAKLQSNNKVLVSVRSSKLLLKGTWHRVQFGVFGRKVYLYVDHVINMGILEHDFFFPVPFAGCMRHISIDETKLPLVPKNVKDARNVIDCDGTPCGGETCLNGGTCWLDSLSSPHCSCLEPYYGDKCQYFPKCTNHSCANGKCQNSMCSCQVGFEGGFCETEIEVKTPSFVGKSYLAVRKLGDKKRDIRLMEIRKLYLKFASASNHGLLLWTKKDKNYLGLGLEKGFLKLVYSMKDVRDSVVKLAPYNRVADGLWHILDLSFAPFSLTIDGKRARLFENQQSAISNASLSSDGLFFIGGLPSYMDITKDTAGLFRQSFQGCIEAFGTNNEPVIKDFTPFEGANISNCHIF